MSKKLKILIAAAGILIIPFMVLPVLQFDSPVSTVVEARDGTLLGARIAGDGQWRFPPSSKVPDKFKKAFLDKKNACHMLLGIKSEALCAFKAFGDQI